MEALNRVDSDLIQTTGDSPALQQTPAPDETQRKLISVDKG